MNESCHNLAVDRDRVALEAVRICGVFLDIGLRNVSCSDLLVGIELSCKQGLLVAPERIMPHSTGSSRPFVVESKAFWDKELHHSRARSGTHPDE